MTTILPIGTTVCKACRAPVAVVRRTVELPCYRTAECQDERCKCFHTHTIPDVAWTVVDENGERRRCAA